MFLRDIRSSGVPDLDKVDATSLNRRIKYRQQLIKDLRPRFRTEYLRLLVHKDTKMKNQRIHVGDVVLIGEDHKKRMNWRLALVKEVIPGRDGLERVVKLRTSTGKLTRPIQRLYSLELCPQDQIVDDVMKDARYKTRSGRVVEITCRFMN